MTPTRNDLVRFGRIHHRARLVTLVTAAAMAFAVPAMAVDQPVEPPGATATPSGTPSAAPDPGTPGDSPTLADPASPSNPASSGTGDGPSLPSPAQAGASSGGVGRHPLTAQADAGCRTIDAPVRPADYSDDFLPCSDLPYQLQPANPAFPPTSTMEQLRDPGEEPTCAAPPMPAPTDADDAKGYTVPIRLKLTNGIMVGGFNSPGWHHGTDMPFSIYNSRMTGWAVGRVQLPSLQVELDPSGVVLCKSTGGGYATASSGSCIRKAVDNGTDPDACAMTLPGGDKYLNIPGPPFIETIGLKGTLHVGLAQAVVSAMSAKVNGLDPTGRLRLSSDLDADLTIAQFLANGTPSIQCPSTLGIGPEHGRSMTTDPLEVASADPQPWPVSGHPGVTIPVASKAPKIFLPGKPLSGAVEGGTATIATNVFDLDILGGTGSVGACQSTWPALFYGVNKWGMLNVGEPGYADPTDPSLSQNSLTHLPIPSGSAEMSIDVTVDQIGLPKGLPTGYGFE